MLATGKERYRQLARRRDPGLLHQNVLHRTTLLDSDPRRESSHVPLDDPNVVRAHLARPRGLTGDLQRRGHYRPGHHPRWTDGQSLLDPMLGLGPGHSG